ncbi:MAG: cell division protein FtsZ [Dehalococcoidia bacterium]
MVHEAGAQMPLPHQPVHAQIKVVGVGGGGVNAVRRMAGATIPGVELLCVNTDLVSLEAADGIPTLAIGADLTRGLGAGGNPETGRRAADETKAQLRQRLEGADLVFIAAGLGGGTGTGAAPVVAAVAQDVGALTIAVVTTPFGFEGPKRRGIAAAGLLPLETAADTVIVVSNQRLLALAKRRTSVGDSFSQADRVVVDAIMAVSRIINVPGDINVDFADIEAIAAGGGMGVVAMGQGQGMHRVLKAIQAAVANPLMARSAYGARGLLYLITGGPDLTLTELNDAGAFVANVADPNAQIIFGMHIDCERGADDPVEAVLIATRLPDEEAQPPEGAVSDDDRVRLATAHYYADGRLPAFLRESA